MVVSQQKLHRKSLQKWLWSRRDRVMGETRGTRGRGGQVQCLGLKKQTALNAWFGKNYFQNEWLCMTWLLCLLPQVSSCLDSFPSSPMRLECFPLRISPSICVANSLSSWGSVLLLLSLQSLPWPPLSSKLGSYMYFMAPVYNLPH